jgi:hypothetical protein
MHIYIYTCSSSINPQNATKIPKKLNVYNYISNILKDTFFILLIGFFTTWKLNARTKLGQKHSKHARSQFLDSITEKKKTSHKANFVR